MAQPCSCWKLGIVVLTSLPLHAYGSSQMRCVAHTLYNQITGTKCLVFTISFARWRSDMLHMRGKKRQACSCSSVCGQAGMGYCAVLVRRNLDDNSEELLGTFSSGAWAASGRRCL